VVAIAVSGARVAYPLRRLRLVRTLYCVRTCGSLLDIVSSDCSVGEWVVLAT